MPQSSGTRDSIAGLHFGCVLAERYIAQQTRVTHSNFNRLSARPAMEVAVLVRLGPAYPIGSARAGDAAGEIPMVTGTTGIPMCGAAIAGCLWVGTGLSATGLLLAWPPWPPGLMPTWQT